MNMLHDSFLLAAKDLRIYVRDRSALCLGFLVPIALVSVFGWIMTYAFGGSSGMPKVVLFVVDEDQSEGSQALIKSLRASEMLNVKPLPDEKPITAIELRKMVQEGDIHHGIIFPKGYGRKESKESSSEVNFKMIRDPGRTMEDRMIQMALMQSSLTTGSAKAWKKSMKKMFADEGMKPEELGQLEDAMGKMQETIGNFLENDSVQPEESRQSSSDNSGPKHDPQASSPKAGSPMDFITKMMAMDTEEIVPPNRSKRITYQQAQSVAGMSVMMLLFGLTGAGALLIAEREMGALKRLFALPIARESVLAGKAIFVFIIGLVQMIVLFVYGELVFQVGLFRDPVTLLAIVVTWVSAASCFGMCIATFSKSAKQADSLSTIIILMMAALGGCWFPLQMMSLPLPMELLTKSMMTYWAMDGLQGMLWNNLSIADHKIQFALLVQWGWAISLGGLSVYFFRRNYVQG